MTTDLEKKAAAFDRIAVLLGASDNWDGGADFLDDIADLVHRASPLGHPGSSSSTPAYRELGRSLGLTAGNDWREEDEEEEEEDVEDVSVCTDCRLTAASAEEPPDRDPGEPAPLSLLENGQWLVPSAAEPVFSAEPCGACGTDRAGDRWPASIVSYRP